MLAPFLEYPFLEVEASHTGVLNAFMLGKKSFILRFVFTVANVKDEKKNPRKFGTYNNYVQYS